jgi:hypothetical protein
MLLIWLPVLIVGFGIALLCQVNLYHHNMVLPQVTDRGDGLQIWRVVANVLNKQSRGLTGLQRGGGVGGCFAVKYSKLRDV